MRGVEGRWCASVWRHSKRINLPSPPGRSTTVGGEWGPAGDRFPCHTQDQRRAPQWGWQCLRESSLVQVSSLVRLLWPAMRVAAAFAACLTFGLVAVALSATPAVASIAIGHTVDGLPIQATRVGAPTAKRVVLVVGEIHGTEPAGIAVVRRLRTMRPPRGVALVLVDSANPDGGRSGTRWNAHGVDLNRNFPFGWRPNGVPFATYYSGP